MSGTFDAAEIAIMIPKFSDNKHFWQVSETASPWHPGCAEEGAGEGGVPGSSSHPSG
jgi:hypothetical protein